MNKPVAVPEPGRICVVNGAPQKSFLFHLLHRRMPEGWSVVGYEEGQNLDVDRIVFLWLAPDFHALRPDVAFNRGEAHITNAVPMDVRQRLARGDAWLLIDATNEAPAVGYLACDHLGETLDQWGVPRERVMYLSSNHQLPHASSRFGMQAHVVDFFAIQLALQLGTELRTAHESLARTWPRRSWTQPMLCLNETPRAHRVALIACLLADGLMSSHFVSWGGWDHGKAKDLAASAREGAESLLADAPEALRHLDAAMRLPRVTFESTSATGNELAFSFPTTLYASSSFSLVSESSINAEVTRLSEKSVKALCGGHFPLIWGTAHSRPLIEKYGFDAVKDDLVWSFDNEEDAPRRLKLVRETYRGIIDRTIFRPEDNVETLMWNMDFGRERLYDHLWIVMIDSLFTRLAGTAP